MSLHITFKLTKVSVTNDVISALWFILWIANVFYGYAILGCDSLPWLGNLSKLGPAAEFSVSPYGDDVQSPFPVTPASKRSYAQNCVVWTKNAGLQVGSILIIKLNKRWVYFCNSGWPKQIAIDPNDFLAFQKCPFFQCIFVCFLSYILWFWSFF